MKCLRCGIEILDGIGLCDRCSAVRKKSRQTRHDLYSRKARRAALIQRVIAITTLLIGILLAVRLIIGSELPPSDGRTALGVQTWEIKKPIPWNWAEFTLSPTERVLLQARVLSVSQSWIGRSADIAPLNFFLGWGPLSNQHIYRQLRIVHLGRIAAYSWKTKSPLLTPEDMRTYSVNLHLIAANPGILIRLNQVEADQILELEGIWIAVSDPNGASDAFGKAGSRVLFVQRVTADLKKS